jgi:glyoxylase-like metal-dependent hydrolase (beta-lactamase superfamily II)
VLFAEGGVGRSDLLGGNEAVLKESILKILRLPETIEVHPGHGGSTTVKALRAVWRDLLSETP